MVEYLIDLSVFHTICDRLLKLAAKKLFSSKNFEVGKYSKVNRWTLF